MILVTDLARAYHCPQAVMAYIARHSPDLLETLRELGPMRVYWCEEWGWKLDGMPVYVARGADGHMVWQPTLSKVDGSHQQRWRSRET